MNITKRVNDKSTYSIRENNLTSRIGTWYCHCANIKAQTVCFWDLALWTYENRRVLLVGKVVQALCHVPLSKAHPSSLFYRLQLQIRHTCDNFIERSWILDRWRQKSVDLYRAFGKRQVLEKSQLKIIIHFIDEILVGPRTRIRCYSIFNWTLWARLSVLLDGNPADS